MAAKRRKNRMNTGTISIIFIVLVFVVVMSIQIYKLKEKDALLKEYEENRRQELTELMLEAEELEKLDSYTKSVEFLIDWAHRLGFVRENETIYKESGE